MEHKNIEEKKLQELYLHFLERYLSQDPKVFGEIVPLIHEKVSAIGSGLYEVVDGREKLVAWGLAEKEAIQTELESEFIVLKARIFGQTGIVWVQANFKIPMGGKILEVNNLRLSTVFNKEGGKWKIVHTHTSVPDAEQNEDELVPLEALKAKNEKLEKLIAERTADLKLEKEKTESLLHNILPVEIAKELIETGKTTPSRYENVSILFTDFEQFTQLVASMSTESLVKELNDIFSAFDDIMESEGLEKIHTVGDAYLATSGLPIRNVGHAIKCVLAAKKIVDFLNARNATNKFKWKARIGIHSGPIIAGVVGKKKFAYDIFGDTVNVASRLESNGEVGKINISGATYELIKDKFSCEYRGKIYAKGKGEMDMYFVNP